MKIREAIEPHMVTHLLNMCRNELNISELPPIEFLEEPVIPGTTSFGAFFGDRIVVVVLNRHPVDVCRTLAHEIVHWKQQVSGEDLDGTTGSNTENDANALAGVILRKFGEKYPEYFSEVMP